jgi:hypothetical protein
LPSLTGIAQLFDVQVLARVDHGFHHHVLLARGFRSLDDLPALVNAGSHRHGAGDVLAGFQRRHAHRRMLVNGGVDVHHIDVGIFEHLVVVGVALLDVEGVADGIELILAALANGVHIGIRVILVDGDELCPEAQAGYGNIDLFIHLFALRLVKFQTMYVFIYRRDR